MTATPEQDRPQDEQEAGNEPDAAQEGSPTTPDEQAPATEADGKTPSTEELEEPSTEKPPGEEPKAADREEPEPSHQAVGIGVIGGPLVDPEPPAEDPGA